MRYLKRFNEALERDVDGDFTAATLDEIKDYCELNLAYLLDLGMTIECSNTIDNDTDTFECQVDLSFKDVNALVVLDQVIPFFKRIVNDYELGELYNTPDKSNFRFIVVVPPVNGSEYNISYKELDDVEGMIMDNPSVQRNIAAGFEPMMTNILFYIKNEK